MFTPAICDNSHVSEERYCFKCAARVEVGDDNFLRPHYKTIASGEIRKCLGKTGSKEKPSSIHVVSGGLPASKRRR